MGIELLTKRYQAQIAGVLCCYDRIIIKGTVPGWCYAKGMTDYLTSTVTRSASSIQWPFRLPV